jgi:hypothetical protein
MTDRNRKRLGAHASSVPGFRHQTSDRNQHAGSVRTQALPESKSEPHLWLVKFIGVIVPRRLRADWQQEWEAELLYRESLPQTRSAPGTARAHFLTRCGYNPSDGRTR